MECPKCGTAWGYVARGGVATTVEEGPAVRRVRACVGCGHQWETVEVPAETVARLQNRRALARRALAVAEIGARFRAEVIGLVKGS